MYDIINTTINYRNEVSIMLTMDTVIKAITPNKATLLSGHRGAHRFISNIHTIEDKESARFIREHELIFITGVAISSTKS